MKAILYSENPPHQLRIETVEEPELKPGCLRIEVFATALNRADLMQKKGMYPPPPGASAILGLEVAGRVLEVDSNCKHFKVGDGAVALLAGGGYASEVVVEESCAWPIPKGFSWEQAAAVPEAFLTAYQALFDLGRLSEGEAVLIHGGASGVGTAAVQLAKAAGAVVFATAGTAEKCRYLEKELGVEKAFNYKEERFADSIRLLTDKKGVQVLVDIAGGSHYEQNMSCIGVDGRWIVLAFMGGRFAEQFDFAKLLMKRVHLMGSTLRGRSIEYKSGLVKGFKTDFLPLLETGKIRPIINKVYSWEQANEAHAYMEANQNIGKVVLSLLSHT